MKKAALAITGVLVLVYIAAIFIPINPNEQQPGTRLSGNFADDQNPDWSFMEGRTRAYIETRSLYLIPHSITVSSWSQNGQLYVGCRACDTKYWPTNVVRDPNIRIKIDDKIVIELAEYCKRKEEIEISLEKQEIKYGNKVVKFELDAFKKTCLMEGLDDIALSMEKINKIDDFEKKLLNTKPWVLNNG